VSDQHSSPYKTDKIVVLHVVTFTFHICFISVYVGWLTDLCLDSTHRREIAIYIWDLSGYMCSIHNGTYQIMCAAYLTLLIRLCAACITVLPDYVKHAWRYVPDYVWSIRDGTYQIVCEEFVTVRTRLCMKHSWRYVPDYVWSIRDGTYQIVCEEFVTVRTRLCVKSSQCNAKENLNLQVTDVRPNSRGPLTHSTTVAAGITGTNSKFSSPAFRDGRIRYWQTIFCMNINLKDFFVRHWRFH
jgi:hypothetical protein